MAEMMPISRVPAPASCRRNDTSGKLAPRLKPTTETANNRPANKRMFMYHSLPADNRSGPGRQLNPLKKARTPPRRVRRNGADQFRQGVARR
jgi:hypothetical protein